MEFFKGYFEKENMISKTKTIYILEKKILLIKIIYKYTYKRKIISKFQKHEKTSKSGSFRPLQGDS